MSKYFILIYLFTCHGIRFYRRASHFMLLFFIFYFFNFFHTQIKICSDDKALNAACLREVGIHDI